LVGTIACGIRPSSNEDDDLGIVKIGSKVKILDVIPVAGKNIWVRVELKNN
jgi:hypothetical protein